MVLSHQRERTAANDFHPINCTLQTQHLTKFGVISGGTDQAAAAGRKTRRMQILAFKRIIDQSQRFISSALIVSSKTLDFLWRDPKCGVLHAQGLEDPLLQKVFKFLPRDRLN